jgi:hypothetical protein
VILTSALCIHYSQGMNAQYLTIRNLPADLSAALEREKRRRGVSLNQTVIDLLQLSLGVRGPRRNGLSRLAGTWSHAEYRDFVKRIESLNEIDEEMWK